MKRLFLRSSASLLIAVFFLSESAQGQRTLNFNFDFESPFTPLSPSGQFNLVPAADALPGWTVYIGNDPYDQVRYNQVSIGGTAVSLIGPGYFGGILQGSYSVVFYPGLSIPAGRTSAGIGRVLTMPPYNSIRFAAAVENEFQVSFAGTTLSLVPLGAGPNSSVLYGADISPFIGQTGEIRFTAPDFPGNVNHVYLDDISFSPEAVPEPSTLGLLVLGFSLLGWRYLRRLH